MEICRVEPDFVTYFVLDGGALSLVVLRFHLQRGFLEGFLGSGMDILHFGDEGIGSRGAEGSGGFRSWEYGGVVAVVDFKGTFTGGRVCAVVMGKGSKGEPFCPVGLEVIDKHAKVFFDFLVDSLGLSICLRVIGGREIALDLEKIVEILHEL